MEDVSLELTIGENIAKYRDAAGLTQQELAERVGISVAFISRVERGEKSMKVRTLWATAEALGVSCDALLRREDTATHMANINRLLAQQPEEYLAGIERMIRVCVEEFDPKHETAAI